MSGLSRFWRSPAEAVFFLVLALMVIGSLTIYSASSVLGQQDHGSSLYYVKRYWLFGSVGLAAVLAALRFGAPNWRLLAKPITLLAFVTLAMVPVMGVVVKGARRWLAIGGFSFQPSEVAKVAVVLMMAVYVADQWRRRRPVTLFSWPMAVTAVFCGLVYKQPDMGTAAFIGFLAVGVLCVGRLSTRDWWIMATSVVLLAIWGTRGAAYRLGRIDGWLDPWGHATTSGYQLVRSLMAIGSGQVLGNGFGQGASKFFYLPEAHTDFAFAVLCEEWGFVGALLVVTLFFLLMLQYAKGCLLTKKPGETVLLWGALLLLCGQAAANMMMVTGLLPVIGVPLPFISYGGTSLLVNLGVVAVSLPVLSRVVKESQTPEQPQDDFPQPPLPTRLRHPRLRVVR